MTPSRAGPAWFIAMFRQHVVLTSMEQISPTHEGRSGHLAP
ncbi:hypothetical protein SXCC_00871 [Gluconacetobacter sp. SXCC-1]|nr:hypothetical protein SXCC_00871 [Gluconacetobacter sp. SXCC-1]